MATIMPMSTGISHDRGAETMTVQRAFFPLILAASVVLVTAYYVRATVGLAALTRTTTPYLLGMVQRGRPVGAALSPVRALAANPLDQQAVNSVIVARARASGDPMAGLREAGLLRRLGWRSTMALQNLLWRAATVNDQPLMMDTLDALLRREKLLGQIYPILNLMTQDPAFRRTLTDRVAARPPWRRYYFMAASDLKEREDIEGRYLVMRAVQRRGDRLTRNEIAPILPKLIAIGLTPQAFALWQTHQGGVTSPLADMHFDQAARPLPADALPVTFEWQLGGGSGYFADTGRDDRGSFLSIDWNGRGTPIFARQSTTGRAGRYRLELRGDTAMADLAKRVGFRLVCGNGMATEFMPADTGRSPRMRMVGAARISCDYPELQLYGLVQAVTTGTPILLRSIRLERIG